MLNNTPTEDVNCSSEVYVDPYRLFLALHFCRCSAFTSFLLRNHHMTFTGLGILIKEKILIFVFSGTVILNLKKEKKKTFQNQIV